MYGDMSLIPRHHALMTVEPTLDDTDWRILTALQQDGRLSWAELARAVAMSPSAVTERVRRLEDGGVISGYAAVVDVDQVGLGVMAFVRLRYPNGNYKPFHDLLDTTPEIVEAHHVTGEDCFFLKVLARSMRHLEEVTGRIGALGGVTTSVVYSSPLPRRAVASDAAAPRLPGARAARESRATGRAFVLRRNRPAAPGRPRCQVPILAEV